LKLNGAKVKAKIIALSKKKEALFLFTKKFKNCEFMSRIKECFHTQCALKQEKLFFMVGRQKNSDKVINK